MSNIKFVNYTGDYPCLCFGVLTIEVNGKEYSGINLISGGSVTFDENWNENVEEGLWSVGTLPEEIEQYREEIEDVVNANVPLGCCGGCV